MPPSNSQTGFLTRVRQALEHAPGWSKRAPVTLTPAPTWSGDALVEQFAAALSAVGGHVYRPADDAGVCEQMANIVVEHKARRVVWVASPTLEGLDVPEILTRQGVEVRPADFAAWVQREGDEVGAREALREYLAGADMAITGAQRAIAETGTLLLVASSANPRSASNLPPVHLAVIRPSQIVSTLYDLAPHLAQAAAQASSLMFITGPSRTSDIEQISTIGVHGPVELHVIVRP